MMRVSDLDDLARSHSRTHVTKNGSSCWLQPVLQDGPRWWCVCSTDQRSKIVTIDDAGLRGITVRRKTVVVDTFVFEIGRPAARGNVDGHNGVAVCTLLLQLFEIGILFSYAKPKATRPEVRRLDLRWVDGERFGGNDYDRGGDLRSFRLDRTISVGLLPTATTRPVWVGDGYERGLL